MTVKEVSKRTGVSIRALHHYDELGLLKPERVSETGYRIYGDKELERLQQILFFKELGFPLKDIRRILDSPDFERNAALDQQIELLTMKKEHLENMLIFAKGIRGIGIRRLDFTVFDTKKLDEYAKEAKKQWGKTEAYKEFEEKQKNSTPEKEKAAAAEMMELFVEFGAMKEEDPGSEKVQDQVKKLQDFITEHFYTCTDQILRGLGKMYSGGGSMTENIDKAGGEGTGEFVDRAIEIYCERRSSR